MTDFKQLGLQRERGRWRGGGENGRNGEEGGRKKGTEDGLGEG